MNISGKRCNSTDLVSEQCHEHETCHSKREECECLPSFKRVNGVCENDTKDVSSIASSALMHESNGSHVIAGVLIPLFLIFVVILGIYVSRRYKVILWIRSKINKRSSNYDEVMIGQDDDDDDLPLQD